MEEQEEAQDLFFLLVLQQCANGLSPQLFAIWLIEVFLLLHQVVLLVELLLVVNGQGGISVVKYMMLRVGQLEQEESFSFFLKILLCVFSQQGILMVRLD
jgi:hypothetical protein